MSVSWLDEATPQQAWLAAFIDGEGSIGINRLLRGDRPSPQFQALVTVANTNREVLEAVAEITGVGAIYSNHRDTSDRRRCFKWQVVSRRAASVLDVIKPFLVIKREQADVVLELQGLLAHSKPGRRHQPEEQERLWLLCKELNTGRWK